MSHEFSFGRPIAGKPYAEDAQVQHGVEALAILCYAIHFQYFTIRSASNDLALIDDFAYVMAVPEPNVAILLGLGLLTLAGTRIRSLAVPPVRADEDER